MPAAGSTTRSDERRALVVDAAVACFARKGFYGTTTHEIAERAGISQPYVYRLFSDKQDLFIAAMSRVSDLLAGALSSPQALGASAEDDPQAALQHAYAALISDRDVLRFLMQANCVTDEPRVRAAVRAAHARQIELVRDRLDGDDDAVRAWFAAGMLDNVVTLLDLPEVDEPWARVLRGH